MNIVERKYGERGVMVLNAFCDVDPLQLSFPTEELDKQEYLGYALRFMQEFAMFVAGDDEYTVKDLTEMVRRSFDIRQIVLGNKCMNLGAIDLIASRIFVAFKEKL